MSQITKRALEQSLKNLLLKKPLTKITINDIAEDCGINRMTFYHPSFPFPLYDDWAGGIKTICVIAGYIIKNSMAFGFHSIQLYPLRIGIIGYNRRIPDSGH